MSDIAHPLNDSTLSVPEPSIVTMKSVPVDEKGDEEEVKSLGEKMSVMDVDDEKVKPRERAKAPRRPESALEMNGDDD